MSRKLEIRLRAQSDLQTIILFIAKSNGDFSVAQKFGHRILDRCNELIIAPGMGTRYRARSGVFKINEGAYNIFYQVTASRIVILRIWDGRRGHNPIL